MHLLQEETERIQSWRYSSADSAQGQKKDDNVVDAEFEESSSK